MSTEVREILEDIRPDVDFETEKNLIDGHILESFDVLTLVSELEDAFDIKIRPRDIIPENFNSLEAICGLIEKLSEKHTT